MTASILQAPAASMAAPTRPPVPKTPAASGRDGCMRLITVLVGLLVVAGLLYADTSRPTRNPGDYSTYLDMARFDDIHPAMCVSIRLHSRA